MGIVSLFFISIIPLYVTSDTPSVSPVAWRTSVLYVNPYQVRISITAVVKPGWCLCDDERYASVKFRFSESDRYIILGKPVVEHSNNFSPHEENIPRCYSGEMNFFQLVRLHEQDVTIEGEVFCIVCMDRFCIPEHRRLTIHLNSHE